METSYYVIIVLFSLLTLVLLIAVLFVNRILNRKQKVEEQLESVMKYLDERVVLFERMTIFVEENVENEVSFANQLNDYITILSDMYQERKYDVKEMNKANKLMKKFAELIKTYPNLSKNEIYKMLVDKNEINIDRIEYSMANYNKKAKEYNEFKKSKINNFISKVLRLSDYECYNK